MSKRADVPGGDGLRGRRTGAAGAPGAGVAGARPGAGRDLLALGDPTRTRILHALSVDELCVSDLAGVLGISASAVSHQLRSCAAIAAGRGAPGGEADVLPPAGRAHPHPGGHGHVPRRRGRARARCGADSTRGRAEGPALSGSGRGLPRLRERADAHLRRQGMCCATEVAMVEDRLGRLPGVCSVRASAVTGKATVVHTVDRRDVEQALAGLGFRARPARGGGPRPRRGPRARWPRWPDRGRGARGPRGSPARGAAVPRARSSSAAPPSPARPGSGCARAAWT